MSAMVLREDAQKLLSRIRESELRSKNLSRPEKQSASNMILDRTEEDEVGPCVRQCRLKQFPQNQEYTESQIRSVATQVVSDVRDSRISIHKALCNQETRQML
jgi:hypothetical protein